MTVCIAAITRESYIVTASDTMVSSWLGSIDASTVKVEEFHENWIAMMAANDLVQCLPIIERAKGYFQGRENSLRVAKSCFKRAYQQHVSEMAADKVLGRFGIDMKSFVNTGKRRFSEKIHNDLCEEIRKVEIDCKFLVYGFDGKKMPHLFTVSYPGAVDDYDKPGFCSIGGGSEAADVMLYHFGQTVDLGTPTTIFNVCAAKFMAEGVPGVGKETFLFVKKYGYRTFSRPVWLLPTLKDAWEREGKPRMPEGIMSRFDLSSLGFL